MSGNLLMLSCMLLRIAEPGPDGNCRVAATCRVGPVQTVMEWTFVSTTRSTVVHVFTGPFAEKHCCPGTQQVHDHMGRIAP